MATSTPVLEPLQPPPTLVAQQQQAYTARSAHGSVGPVIGVLAVITILGAIAVMIGRLCSGRGIRGRAQYDFEGWVETKCASCIDGRVDYPPPPPPPPPPPRAVAEHGGGTAAAAGGAEEEGNQHQHEHRLRQQE